MENREKTGWSLITLILVILVMSFAIFFVSRIFNNSEQDKASEEAFKLNVYSYYLQVEDYKAQRANDTNFSVDELDVCGVDMKEVIPDIKERDLSKFKIEDGNIIYIGVDENEAKWTNEVKI